MAIACFLVNDKVTGQSSFTIGEKTYPSTYMMTFTSGSDHNEKIDVCIAKEAGFGYIAISKSISTKSGMFAGKLILHLEGGGDITCDEVNGRNVPVTFTLPIKFVLQKPFLEK